MNINRDIRCALAFLGGNWNNRSNDGLSNWNLNNGSGNTNINIGGQTLISLLVTMHFILLAPWRKFSHKEQGLVGENSKHLEANKKE